MATPFRAVVVGGGLVGLTAAHVLSKAGIDFVVLEKHHTPLSPYGSTLALWPQTFRIFDQLGLLDAVQAILEHADQVCVVSTTDGRIKNMDKTMDYARQNHGYGVRISHRPEMVRFLYESLSDEAKVKILLAKTATSIRMSDERVEVLCEDGSEHNGSIIIGADGVRSLTRLHMRAMASGKDPDDLAESQSSPYKSTYRVYFGMCPILAGLTPNCRYDATGDGISAQIVNGANRAWFGVYEQLDPPRPKVTKYSASDKDALLGRLGDVFMAPGWRLRDVDEHRTGEATMIDLEEGLVDKWFHDRVVLVGDAVRKLEPHAGLGYNSGITDLVVLVNGLRRLLQGIDSPTTHDLVDLFRSYQSQRQNDTRAMHKISMRAARILAWPTLSYKVLSMYLLPNLPITKLSMAYTVGPLISASPVLDWVGERDLPTCDLPWKVINDPLLWGRGT